MKLRSLRLHGFKSFADATTIEFHDGITAVVGPNGCGKSNISDAIRWVLGEQRPSAIRGAKMEEAIFQGTVGRRPVNRGSVALTVSNEDGALPVPFAEVELGRQVFRDGGSEYSINRSTCRLRDVIDLCRDTGLGANAYSIIENRMIDSILSDRAEERRALFEEAAGIGKYKDRRKAATRRLERAEMDLQRLEDVISEVQSKVRSLARQKGKAQRYHEYRQRRLDVEVAVVRHQLDTLRHRLAGVEKSLESDVHTGEEKIAELRAAEVEYETLRLKEVDAEKGRSGAAKSLESIRGQLVTWERDLAVADERAVYAGRRLAQIEDERAEAVQQAEGLARDEEVLGGDRDRVSDELDRIRAVASAQAADVAQLRDAATTAGQAQEAVETRERDLARRGAQLEGDADASDAQAQELSRHLDRVAEELDSTAETLSELEAQGDLFSGRLEDLSAALDQADARVIECAADLEAAGRALDSARTDEREALSRRATWTAKVAALKLLERDQDGVEPVVQAVLAQGDRSVHGTLAEFIGATGDTTELVESYLGSLTRALVVEDQDTVKRMVAWFRDEWDGGGGLALLPLDAVPAPGADAASPLLAQIQPKGAGAGWVRALLDGVETPQAGQEGAPITRASGVVRVGNPAGASGILERKEQLCGALSELESADVNEETATSAREQQEEQFSASEEALRVARSKKRAAEDDVHRVRSERAAQTDQQSRVDRLRDELARQMEGAKAARSGAIERAQEARDDRSVLLEQEDGLSGERATAREALEEATNEWESARVEEGRMAVDVARLEGDATRLAERLDVVVAALSQATTRAASLNDEEKQLKGEQAQAQEVRAEGDAATERLFTERTTAESTLRERDEALGAVAAALGVSEKRVREARTQERAGADQRHALELEQQELKGRIDRIRERLEAEWARPLEALLQDASPIEGEPAALETELNELLLALERIGPVNMLAVEEHEEESERLAFITEQHDDLVEARNDLRSAIREINKTATDLFMGTFEDIRENFRKTFVRLFEGGEADIWLQDEDDPLESPIEIHASPRGKRTQRIDLLSGGERALTALSLLFGIYLVKPSPFCVLDEVDAPLDENNIGRFIKLLEDFKAESQFVVITHNPRTIEAADWIYGVTMEEPGVSTIVGVKLEEALEAAGAA
jgi:chromosome segregation protein